MRRMPDAWGGNAPVPVRKGQGTFAWSGRFPLAACGPPSVFMPETAPLFTGS